MLETLAIGAMNFGRRTPDADAMKIVGAAIVRGATFFDTANVYSEGDSERILGRALARRRHEVRIATKVGVWRREGLSKARVLTACDESLERLKTDYVDVYYLHTPDHVTPIGETLEAIAMLLKAGKIRAWGTSNYAAWQLVEINALCDQLNMPRPAYSQVLYNMLIRQIEIEYLPFAKRHPIHTTVYNPLAGGLLARPVTKEIPPGSRFAANSLYRKRYWSNRMQVMTQAMQDIADDASIGLVTMAYSWLLRQPGVRSVLAGPATVEHLNAAIEAVETVLPDEVVKAIDDRYRELIGTDASYVR